MTKRNNPIANNKPHGSQMALAWIGGMPSFMHNTKPRLYYLPRDLSV